MSYLKLLLRLYSFMRSANYRRAEAAVTVIAADRGLRNLGEIECSTSYCSKCGQKPDRDIRHDSAFELAFGDTKPKARTRDLHFSLELANWLRK